MSPQGFPSDVVGNHTPHLLTILSPHPASLGPPCLVSSPLGDSLLCTSGVWGLVIWLYKGETLNSHVMLYTSLFISKTVIPDSV